MDIGYVWDETKYQTVVKEHNVKFYEVVAALEDPAGFEETSLVAHENRWLSRGQDAVGSFIDHRFYRPRPAALSHHYRV